jgi:DNA-binding NarL/FixJ family response regulator
MIERKLGGRALVVDNHPVAQEGLTLAARAALPGVAVVPVRSVREASEVARRGPLRMILLDYSLPDAVGFSGLLTLQMHAPTTPVVLVTASEESRLVEAARALGAAGYLFKRLPIDLIAQRLREADAGELVFPAPEPTGLDLRGLQGRLAQLSPAQRNVLLSLADGRSNKLLARDLDVREATVKAHLTAIYRKLGVGNRNQALLMMQPLLGIIHR